MRKRIPMILVLLLALPLLFGASSARSYGSGNYMLELDGVQAGFVRSVTGGNAYAEVVSEPMGPDYFVRKHIGQVKYEDFQMQIGFGMAKPVYDWISESWKGTYQRKAGAVIATDYNLHPKSRREFANALLTETTIPAMDAGSKEPGYLTLKLTPELVRFAKTESEKGSLPVKTAQKTWLPSNFRLEIDGLDTSRVSKIDAFTIKQSVVQDDVGQGRDPQHEPAKLEFPNLKITLSAVGADDWLAWYEEFVIKGNNDQSQEKSGSLRLLAVDQKEVLATIRFHNMGVVSIREVEGSADALPRYEVELYVERMEFDGPRQ